MAEQLKNSLDNPTSTLAVAAAAGDLTITVAAGHGSRFPATGTFRIKLTDEDDDTLYELVIGTSRSGDVITVTRGAEGTAARAFNANDLVDLVLSEAALAAYVAENSASDADLAAHVAAADPHTGYQKESEKGVAGGYASLDGSGQVPDAQLAATIARDIEIVSAVTAHEGDTTSVHGIADTSALVLASRTITAGDGLSGGGDLSGDRTLAVNVDGATLETNADTLRVKDGGITSAKIADGTIATSDHSPEAAAPAHLFLLRNVCKR